MVSTILITVEMAELAGRFMHRLLLCWIFSILFGGTISANVKWEITLNRVAVTIYLLTPGDNRTLSLRGLRDEETR